MGEESEKSTKIISLNEEGRLLSTPPMQQKVAERIATRQKVRYPNTFVEGPDRATPPRVVVQRNDKGYETLKILDQDSSKTGTSTELN